MVLIIKFMKFHISLCLNIKINFQILGNEKQLRLVIPDIFGLHELTFIQSG